MVFAEDIRKTILKLADECGAGRAFSPKDIATRVDKKNAQDLLDQVYFVASILVKEGKITSIKDETAPELPIYVKKG